MTSRQTKQNDGENQKSDAQVMIQKIITTGGIIVATVTVLGGIVTGLFQNWDKIFPSPTPTPALLVTEIPPMFTPSATSVIPSDTPAPTDTPAYPCTFTQTCTPGEDWARNCIDKEIWSTSWQGALPAPTGLCYDLARWGIVASDGNLSLVTTQFDETAREYGVFTPWQGGWSGLDVVVKARQLGNAEVWVGFFEEASLQSNGLVFVVQSGNTTVDVRRMPSGEPLANNVGLPDWAGTYSPQIRFSGGKMSVAEGGQNILFPTPVNFTVKYLFIGYRSLPGTNLDATIAKLYFVR